MEETRYDNKATLSCVTIIIPTTAINNVRFIFGNRILKFEHVFKA